MQCNQPSKIAPHVGLHARSSPTCQIEERGDNSPITWRVTGEEYKNCETLCLYKPETKPN